MKSSYFFIINRRIGEKKISQVEEAIELYFSTEKTIVYKTEFGGHASILCQQALQENYTHVVAVGGDGTVNEVIQTLATTDIILGIVPCGSGNGLARHCNIPLTIKEAVKIIISGKKSCIDLGRANGIYFISNAGVGIDALVSHDIKQSTRRGLKMYAWNIAKRYFSYKPEMYSIELDNGKTLKREAYFLNIANGKEFGYGFEIAPEASLTDGLLDLIIVNKMKFFSGFKFIYDGWTKKLIYNPNCYYERGKQFIIKANNLNFFQADGDAHACEGQCIFTVCEKALHLMVPENSSTL